MTSEMLIDAGNAGAPCEAHVIYACIAWFLHSVPLLSPENLQRRTLPNLAGLLFPSSRPLQFATCNLIVFSVRLASALFPRIAIRDCSSYCSQLNYYYHYY